MKLKMRILKVIGTSKLTPRWVKVICLRITMSEIVGEFGRVFKGADLSKLSEQQKRELQQSIDRVNLITKKGIDA